MLMMKYQIIYLIPIKQCPLVECHEHLSYLYYTHVLYFSVISRRHGNSCQLMNVFILKAAWCILHRGFLHVLLPAYSIYLFLFICINIDQSD